MCRMSVSDLILTYSTVLLKTPVLALLLARGIFRSDLLFDASWY
jgi:hypothetical protein